MTSKPNKKATIKTHQGHGKDTGSTPVQIAILTDRIKHLTDHLKTHAKDVHSRRGLIGLVGRRKKLLRYLKEQSSSGYQQLIKKLGIRG